MRIYAKVGDCFAIPLADGSFGHAQYVHFHPQYACLLRVFACIGDEPIPVEELRGVPDLFPPIFAGLNPPLRAKRWINIGNFPIVDFRFPTFRYAHGIRPGLPFVWKLWDGSHYQQVDDLTPEQRKLEHLCVWAATDVEERILTRQNVFENVWGSSYSSFGRDTRNE